MVNFSPFNYSIPYSGIEKIVLKKNLVCIRYNKDSIVKTKRIAFDFAIQSFSRKNKREYNEILPVLRKYFPSKLDIKIKDFY